VRCEERVGRGGAGGGGRGGGRLGRGGGRLGRGGGRLGRGGGRDRGGLGMDVRLGMVVGRVPVDGFLDASGGRLSLRRWWSGLYYHKLEAEGRTPLPLFVRYFVHKLR